MLAKTHLAFGFLSGLVAMPFVATGNTIIFFSLVLIGALLPDIDQPNSKISNKIPIIPKIINIFAKHRGIFHTVFLAIIIPGLLWYFIAHSYGIALFVGYMSHLIIDGFTVTGINFLHPFSKLHLSGFVETGTIAELVIFFVILAGIAIKLL